MPRLRTVPLVLLLVGVFALTGCSSSGSADTSGVKDIGISVVGGQVSPPPDRIQVAKGQRVRLTVRSDVADVVHVHGFDQMAALQPDKPATLEFVADQAGVFEVETHTTKLQLCQLAVS
jgi:plastocyanin domain-containing protein